MNDRPRKLEPRRPYRTPNVAGGTGTRSTESRPQFDHSWRDRTDRNVKGWDRGKVKQHLRVRKVYRDSLTWFEHVAILEKAGIRVQDLKPWEMKYR
jgi:hypothetical protein